MKTWSLAKNNVDYTYISMIEKLLARQERFLRVQWGGLLAKVEPDLLLINIWSLALLATLAVQPLGVLQPFLGFPFVVFFPGYVALKAFFSREEINLLERIALSFGLSMLIVPAVAAIVAYSPAKVTSLSTILPLSLFILVISAIGQYSGKFSLAGRVTLGQCTRLLKLGLPFLLITLLALIVRFYPVLELSMLPGHWDPGNSLYPIFHTLQTGELLETKIINNPTPFTKTIFNHLHNRAAILFEVSTFLAMGVEDLDAFLWLNKFFPWHGALVFPLSTLLLTTIVWKGQKNDVAYKYWVLIYLVAAFFSANLLGFSRSMTLKAVMGFSAISFTTYFAMKSRPDAKSALLAALFGMSIFLYYYTAGAVFLFLISFVAVAQWIKRHEIIPRSLVLFYVAAFSGYYLLVVGAPWVLRQYIGNIIAAFLNPGAASLQRTLGGGIFDLGSVAHLAAYANFLLIGLPVVVFIFAVLRKKIPGGTYTFLPIYCSLGLIPVGILAFLWRGLKGFARIETYIPLVCILALAFLLSSDNPRLRLFAIITSLLMVVTTIVAFAPGTALRPVFLTHQEKEAIEWPCEDVAQSGLVFTDSRIGTAPVMLDCFKFTGIWGLLHKNPAQEGDLLDVYYRSNPVNAKMVLTKYEASHLLISEQMKDVGIYTLPYGYSPPPPAGLAKYESSSLFNKVYDSGGAQYYYVRP